MAARFSDEVGCVRLTPLAWRWGEAGKLVGGADDRAAVDGGAEKAVEEVAEGVR